MTERPDRGTDRSATTTSTYRVTTSASPRRAFAVLADLDGYSLWLPRSIAYRGTSTATGEHAADAYADSTGFGKLTGTITEKLPDRRIVFAQQTARGRLRIRISYNIAPVAGGTEVSRTGVITTRGAARRLHWIVVALIRCENARTMRHLRAHLDQTTDTDQEEP